MEMRLLDLTLSTLTAKTPFLGLEVDGLECGGWRHSTPTENSQGLAIPVPRLS